jgi:NRAMP (natural resistance-associated macrophage protein)-like metal ion transporter
MVGPGAALAFALALLASGFAASSVGTYAGQVVMQGFINRTIPLAARRLVTMLPALVVLGLGLDPSRALVISQVVLSFGIPFALVPLVLLTRRRSRAPPSRARPRRRPRSRPSRSARGATRWRCSPSRATSRSG